MLGEIVQHVGEEISEFGEQIEEIFGIPNLCPLEQNENASQNCQTFSDDFYANKARVEPSSKYGAKCSDHKNQPDCIFSAACTWTKEKCEGGSEHQVSIRQHKPVGTLHL